MAMTPCRLVRTFSGGCVVAGAMVELKLQSMATDPVHNRTVSLNAPIRVGPQSTLEVEPLPSEELWCSIYDATNHTGCSGGGCSVTACCSCVACTTCEQCVLCDSFAPWRLQLTQPLQLDAESNVQVASGVNLVVGGLVETHGLWTVNGTVEMSPCTVTLHPETAFVFSQLNAQLSFNNTRVQGSASMSSLCVCVLPPDEENTPSKCVVFTVHPTWRGRAPFLCACVRGWLCVECYVFMLSCLRANMPACNCALCVLTMRLLCAGFDTILDPPPPWCEVTLCDPGVIVHNITTPCNTIALCNQTWCCDPPPPVGEVGTVVLSGYTVFSVDNSSSFRDVRLLVETGSSLVLGGLDIGFERGLTVSHFLM